MGCNIYMYLGIGVEFERPWWLWAGSGECSIARSLTRSINHKCIIFSCSPPFAYSPVEHVTHKVY